jgi:hypothetical protein
MTSLLTTLAVLTALGGASAQVPEAWKDWPPEVFNDIGIVGAAQGGPVVEGIGPIGLDPALVHPELVPEVVRVPRVAMGLADAVGNVGSVTLDTKLSYEALRCRAFLTEKHLTPEQFATWVQENRVSPEVLTEAFHQASHQGGQAWRDHFPGLSSECTALGAALLSAAGDDLEGIGTLPVTGRLWLARYLVTVERDDDAVRAIGAVTDEQVRALPKWPALYLTADYLMQEAPKQAMSVLRRFGRLQGDERHLCLPMQKICEQLRDRDVVEKQLVPAAIGALKSMPPTDHWKDALLALIWGRTQLGDSERALSEGRTWLRRVVALGADPRSDDACAVRLVLAQLCAAAGLAGQAGEMLRLAVEECQGPAGARARYQQALWHYAQGQQVAALSQFEEVAAKYPGNYWSTRAQWWLMKVRGRSQSATD